MNQKAIMSSLSWRVFLICWHVLTMKISKMKKQRWKLIRQFWYSGNQFLMQIQRNPMIANNYQKAIYNILGSKTIAYNANLAKVLGSVKAAILLGQLLYWNNKGEDKEWIYKKTEELQEETALTYSEQTSAINICKEKGVLEVKLARIPATRHFRVNNEKLIDLIARFKEKPKLVLRQATNSVNENQKTTTYSTPENTSYRNRDIINEKKVLAKKMKI